MSSSAICISIAAMEVLDGDDVRLSSRGKYAERDIVQVFIELTFQFLCNQHKISSSVQCCRSDVAVGIIYGVSFFLSKNIHCGYLTEMVLMRSFNICFNLRNKKKRIYKLF